MFGGRVARQYNNDHGKWLFWPKSVLLDAAHRSKSIKLSDIYLEFLLYKYRTRAIIDRS